MALLGSLTCRKGRHRALGAHLKGSPAHREQPPLNLSHSLPAQHLALSQFHNLFAPLFPSSHGVLMVLPPWEGLQKLQSVSNIPPHLIFKTFREGDDAVTCFLEKKAVKVCVVGGLESGLEPWSCLLQLCGSGQRFHLSEPNCLTCKMGKPRPSTVVRNKSNKVCGRAPACFWRGAINVCKNGARAGDTVDVGFAG